MVQITFLGGCQEIGGSGVIIESNNQKILLDYGIYLRKMKRFPLHVPPRELSAIFLTHAHLDHSGALPLLYISENIPLYATPITLELTEILLKDLIKLSEYFLPFEMAEVTRMFQCGIPINNSEKISVGKTFNVKTIDAGHIPGSFSVLVEVERKKILYSSDINTLETQLLTGANIDIQELDALIIESTYGLRDHIDRKELEKGFINAIYETVEDDGVALIPAFAISRSQEILCILHSHDMNYPVSFDGMGKVASRIMLKYPQYLRDYKLFQKAHNNSKWIKNKRERDRITSEPGVIVAPAGMLNGGNAVYYAQRLLNNQDNAIFLVGYQVTGTPGRVLIDKKELPINGIPHKVNASVEYFDFSSHCGRSQLMDIIKGVKGNPSVFVVHGEEEACKTFAKDVKTKSGLSAIAPENGQTYQI
ncbi:MAG: MBL fold metallo-hydrolase [Candidatus Hodarchaeota archaeon]